MLDSKLPVLLVTGFYDIYTEGVLGMWSDTWESASEMTDAAKTMTLRLSDLAAAFAKGDILRPEIAGASANQFWPHTNVKVPFHVQTKSRVAHNAVCCCLTIPEVASRP